MNYIHERFSLSPVSVDTHVATVTFVVIVVYTVSSVDSPLRHTGREREGERDGSIERKACIMRKRDREREMGIERERRVVT